MILLIILVLVGAVIFFALDRKTVWNLAFLGGVLIFIAVLMVLLLAGQ